MILDDATGHDVAPWAPEDAADIDVTGLAEGEIAAAWEHETEARIESRRIQTEEHDVAAAQARASETRAQTQEREIATLRAAADKQNRLDVAEARRVLREKNAMDEVSRLAGDNDEAAKRIRDARAVQAAAEKEAASHIGVDELEAAIRAIDLANGTEDENVDPDPVELMPDAAAELDAHWHEAAVETDAVAGPVDIATETVTGEHTYIEATAGFDFDADRSATVNSDPELIAQGIELSEASDEVVSLRPSPSDSVALILTAVELEAVLSGAATAPDAEAAEEPAPAPAHSDEVPAFVDEAVLFAVEMGSPQPDVGVSSEVAPAVAGPDAFDAETASAAGARDEFEFVVSEPETEIADDAPVEAVAPEGIDFVDREPDFVVGPAIEDGAASFDELVFGFESETDDFIVTAPEDVYEGLAVHVAKTADDGDFIVGPETDFDEDVTVELPDLFGEVDVLDQVAVEDFAADDDVVVAEMVEPAAEPAQVEPVAEAAPEVHIHHHYAADPVAPQIIFAQAPPTPPEQPAPSTGARETSVAHTEPERQRRAPEHTPEPKVRRTEIRNEYIGAPVDENDVTEVEAFVPAPKVKEPLFMWRGKPIGGTKLSPEQQAAAQQAALGPRPTAASSTAITQRAKITRQYVSSGVNTQTWFDDTVQECLRLGVSDLHINAEADGAGGDVLHARIRIDGQLRPFQTIEGGDARQIINKFKTSSSMSTDGSFIPEEAVYDVVVDGEERKARVASFRTARGGDAIVLRLPPTGGLRSLEDLEFSAENLDLFHDLLKSANRMLLMAGPMGSGKTTTVHGALMQVATPGRAVWSIEDPVERTIPGMIQLEVDERNGAGFEALLPVLVRSDYDTLFLGEIRDKATASAGVRQAKAGRQVLSTIHATDNVMALKRLIELSGDTPMAVLDSVLGVVSQRLVRKLNPAWDGWNPETKYKGRAPIHEVLRLNDQLIEALTGDITISEQKRVAADQSPSTFAGDALRLVGAGITDWDEINRVLGS